MNIKELTEKLRRALNEEDSLEVALTNLQEVMEETKHLLDDCYKRVVYRTKENVSYFGDDALDRIYEVINAVTSAQELLTDKVYNDIIG